MLADAAYAFAGAILLMLMLLPQPHAIVVADVHAMYFFARCYATLSFTP